MSEALPVVEVPTTIDDATAELTSTIDAATAEVTAAPETLPRPPMRLWDETAELSTLTRLL